MTAGGAISSGYGAGELPSAAVGRGESWLGRLFCRSSFTPGTQVLMADGSKKNIEDLRVGDKVLATDPKTGKTKAEPILGTITSKGDKTLVQISIATKAPALAWMADSGVNPSPLNLQGIGQSKSGMVIATNNHPFWVAGDINAWVMATDLKPGMWLRTSAGTYVQVTATKHWTARHQRVHNLTVANTHTFYVEAGTTPVLVHNCGTGPDGLINLEKASQSGAAADRGGYSFAGRALQKHANRVGTGVNWPRPSGVQNPAAWNEAGQNMLDDVLTNPDSIAHLGYGRIGGTWQDTVDVRLPSGLGARFDFNGNFSGFLD